MGQTLAVVALILVATFLLGKRFIGAFTGNSKSGCEKCASNQVVKQKKSL